MSDTTRWDERYAKGDTPWETGQPSSDRTAPGEMGEQLVVSGIAVDRLATGTRLRLGKDVIIEVLKPRTGCDRLRHIQGCTPAEVAGRLGVMARVLVGGTIQLEDAVVLDEPDRADSDRGA